MIKFFFSKPLTKVIFTNYRFNYSSKRSIQMPQHILTHYLHNRFQFTTNDYVSSLLKLKEMRFNQKDSRFKNMLLSIERNIQQFQLQAKLKILWILVAIQCKQTLHEKLLVQLQKSIDKLTLKQAAVYSWCVAKSTVPKSFSVLKMMDRVKAIFKVARGMNEHNAKESIDIQNLEYQAVGVKQNINDVTPLSCVLIIWSMGKLRITDNQIFNVIIKNTVIPNLSSFSNRHLVVIINSCLRLQYNKKKQLLKMLAQIRQRYEELQSESALTLYILAQNISKLDVIESKFLIWITQQFINKHEKPEKSISCKFSSNLLWCLLINNIYDRQVINILLKSFLHNLDLSNGIDCSMVLFCLFKSSYRKEFIGQIRMLIRRIQRIFSSLNQKSKQLIQELVEIPEFQSNKLKRVVSQMKIKQ